MDYSDVKEPSLKKRRIENGYEKDEVEKHILLKHVKVGSRKSQDQVEKPILLKNVKVGSRKSQLALFQTNFVADLLRKKYTGISYEIITMNTTGDKILDVALSKIGEKSLFTKELEIALDKEEVHMLVHSLKDLPTTLPPGMVIGAICKRENPFDVAIFRSDLNCTNLKDLPSGSIIGTSSNRRIAQLRRLYPDLEFHSIRGNLNTRFRKLDEDKLFSAIILAAAGVIRLDLTHRIGQTFKSDECMYAVGQGALAIECKDSNFEIINLLSKISDKDTTLCCIAERAFMRKLEGGCSVPVAVHSTIENKKLTLQGGVFSLDGSRRIIEELSIELPDEGNQNISKKEQYVGIIAPHIPHHLLKLSEDLGIKLAELLLQKGASSILNEVKKCS